MLSQDSLKEHARRTGLDLERTTLTIATPRPMPYSILKDFLEIGLKRIKKEEVMADIVGESKNSDHWHIRLSIGLDKKEKKEFQSCIEYLATKRFSNYYKQEDIDNPERRNKFKHLVRFEIHHFDSYIDHDGHNFVKHLVKL